jgi:hypothetical protein
MSPDQIDVNALLRGQVSVRPEEHPDERLARLRAEERSYQIEDYKGVAVFIVLLTGMTAIGILCIYASFFDSTASADTKQWSQTVLSSLLTGAVSFVVGRRVGK